MDVVCNGKSPSKPTNLAIIRNKSVSTYKSSENMNWFIHTLFARQEYQYCNEIIDQQLALYSEQEYLYFIKGLIAKAEGDKFAAIKYLQKTIQINPKNSDNYKEIGKCLYSLGRWKQSLEVFLKAETLLERPDHEIYHFIGELLYKNIGQPSAGRIEAKEYFRRSVQNGRQNDSYRKLAEIYREENNYTKSIEMLENCLQFTPENVDILTEIGILYLKINDTKNAFDKLFDVTKIVGNDDCSKALIALGAILQSRNDVDGALNKYKAISAIQLESAEIFSNIGLCFYKKQKLIAAIACLKKSTWMSPLNFNCLYNLGLVYLTAHQFASAYQTLATAINLRPDNAECYMLLGICLKNLNDHDNAYLAFERSAMLPEAIKNPLIYLNFAIYCSKTNHLNVAKQNLANFQKICEQQSVRGEYIRIAGILKKNLPKMEENVLPIENSSSAEVGENENNDENSLNETSNVQRAVDGLSEDEV